MFTSPLQSVFIMETAHRLRDVARGAPLAGRPWCWVAQARRTGGASLRASPAGSKCPAPPWPPHLWRWYTDDHPAGQLPREVTSRGNLKDERTRANAAAVLFRTA